jgi:hypothetical protein
VQRAISARVAELADTADGILHNFKRLSISTRSTRTFVAIGGQIASFLHVR